MSGGGGFKSSLSSPSGPILPGGWSDIRALLSHHDCRLSASPVSCHSVIWPLLALLQLVNAVQILFPASRPQSAHAGVAAAMQTNMVKPSKSQYSNQAVLMQLPFLMLSVGSLHISEVSTPAYRAISTAPPKIQLSPPVPPIPQQSPLWCQISDTQLPNLPNVARCQSRSFLARILRGGHWASSALNAFTCVATNPGVISRE